MAEAKRVLVLTPTAEMADAFRPAAEKLGLLLTFGCGDQSGALRLDFSTRDAALAVVNYAEREPFAGLVAVSDETAAVAARAASMLGLPFHTPKGADACRDKRLLARRLEAAGLSVAETTDGAQELTLECLMSNERLRLLAAVRESSILRPGELEAGLKASVSDALRRIVRTLGLKHGPVQVRLLVSAALLCVCNVSCSYVPGSYTSALQFSIPLVDQDVSLEELILRNALELDTSRVLLGTISSIGH